MPQTKSAKKALRQAIKRTAANRKIKEELKKAIKKASTANLAKVQALIDKAAKRHVIHKNKAARLKSRLFKKFGNPKPVQKTKSSK